MIHKTIITPILLFSFYTISAFYAVGFQFLQQLNTEFKLKKKKNEYRFELRKCNLKSLITVVLVT